MKFRESLNYGELSESLILSLNEEEQFVELEQELELMESVLNEFLGLNKLATKIKERADKKAVDRQASVYEKERATNAALELKKKQAEEKAAKEKEKIESAKEKSNGLADKIAGVSKKIDDKIKTVAELRANDKEEMSKRKEEIKKRFTSVVDKSKKAFDSLSKTVVDALTPEQKELASELAPLFRKLTRGANLSGDDTLKILAAVQSGVGKPGQFPTKKDFDKKLASIKALPGFETFHFSVTADKEASAQLARIEKIRAGVDKKNAQAKVDEKKETPKAEAKEEKKEVKKEKETPVSDADVADVRKRLGRQSKWLNK
jgi:hypothetical protein